MTHGRPSRRRKKPGPNIPLPRIYGRPKRSWIAHNDIFQSVPTGLRAAMQHWPRKERAKRSGIPKVNSTNSNAESLLCRRFVVTGRVQGVFFRASTCDVAIQLSLTGYVKNLPDGSVEVLACGSMKEIEKLEAWLLEGPRMASVTGVDAKSLEFRELDGFGTG